MSRLVRVALIQAVHDVHGDESVEKHKEAALEKHLQLIARAAEAKSPGTVLRALFLCRTEQQMVCSDRKGPGGADYEAYAGAGKKTRPGPGCSPL